MEDSKKKPILIAVVLGCLVLAGIITFATRKNAGIKDTGKVTWLKCRKCKAEFQMNDADYQKYAIDYLKLNPMAPLVKVGCKECGEEAAVLVEKCEKCGNAFVRGSAGLDKIADTCPKCGYSKIEENRKNKRK